MCGPWAGYLNHLNLQLLQWLDHSIAPLCLTKYLQIDSQETEEIKFAMVDI